MSYYYDETVSFRECNLSVGLIVLIFLNQIVTVLTMHHIYVTRLVRVLQEIYV